MPVRRCKDLLVNVTVKWPSLERKKSNAVVTNIYGKNVSSMRHMDFIKEGFPVYASFI